MSKYLWLKKNPPIPQAIGIVMLAWALVPINPYGYYVLLRVVLCGILLYLATKAHEVGRVGWIWILSIAAVAYNPFLRIHLNRELWSIVNIISIGLLVAMVFV